MNRLSDHRINSVRAEVVTTTFVASGTPEGIHDLGRFLEMLNNPAIARHIELREPAIRPLYRAAALMQLESPLLVRRDDIVFANFEGPHFTRGNVRPPVAAAPVLLMAPPFQISGTFDATPGADPTQALRQAAHGFFVVRNACVYDAEGNVLGEGDHIIVNGTAVQMTAASRRHIDAVAAPTRRPAAPAAPAAHSRATAGESEAEEQTEPRVTRAA